MSHPFINRTGWFDLVKLYVPTGTIATMPTPPRPPARRGRPRAGERTEREQAIREATLTELIENGFDRVTMLKVAKRAGVSKETLYSWFGNKEGLFAALIEANGDQAAHGVATALQAGGTHRSVLIGLAEGLLRLLTGPESVAINRAAMRSPELAAILLAGGRHRVGPLVESYLASLHEAGDLQAPDPAASFTMLYGLIMEDRQIRVLLGEEPSDAAATTSHATIAIDRFLTLSSTDR
jgi:AcrR family transcriptional regulator